MSHKISDCKIEQCLNDLEDAYADIMAHMQWKYHPYTRTEYKLNSAGVYEKVTPENKSSMPATRRSRIC